MSCSICKAQNVNKTTCPYNLQNPPKHPLPLQHSSLFQASLDGNIQAVRSLITAGVDVGQIYFGGTTALHFATENGHVDVVRALLEAGADVGQQAMLGVTALMVGSQNGYVDVVRVLLEAGADVGQQATDGWTALMLGSQNGHVEIMRLLAEKGEIDVEYLKKFVVGTPLVLNPLEKAKKEKVQMVLNIWLLRINKGLEENEENDGYEQEKEIESSVFAHIKSILTDDELTKNTKIRQIMSIKNISGTMKQAAIKAAKKGALSLDQIPVGGGGDPPPKQGAIVKIPEIIFDLKELCDRIPQYSTRFFNALLRLRVRKIVIAPWGDDICPMCHENGGEVCLVRTERAPTKWFKIHLDCLIGLCSTYTDPSNVQRVNKRQSTQFPTNRQPITNVIFRLQNFSYKEFTAIFLPKGIGQRVSSMSLFR